ncbi:hypothetical protein LTR36_004878 [Oleoguttula mirabilis]|uniref:Uncharacterized protein n=1 Tax=Oleoguttula mirabilis TaxID=1507867 RepID=A0AAV9JEV0_9PEZI|nr:hypothetical protein LTR36_004878 [Oleoguttula mirabilis]
MAETPAAGEARGKQRKRDDLSTRRNLTSFMDPEQAARKTGLVPFIAPSFNLLAIAKHPWLPPQQDFDLNSIRGFFADGAETATRTPTLGLLSAAKDPWLPAQRDFDPHVIEGLFASNEPHGQSLQPRRDLDSLHGFFTNDAEDAEPEKITRTPTLGLLNAAKNLWLPAERAFNLHGIEGLFTNDEPHGQPLQPRRELNSLHGLFTNDAEAAEYGHASQTHRVSFLDTEAIEDSDILESDEGEPPSDGETLTSSDDDGSVFLDDALPKTVVSARRSLRLGESMRSTATLRGLKQLPNLQAVGDNILVAQRADVLPSGAPSGIYEDIFTQGRYLGVGNRGRPGSGTSRQLILLKDIKRIVEAEDKPFAQPLGWQQDDRPSIVEKAVLRRRKDIRSGMRRLWEALEPVLSQIASRGDSGSIESLEDGRQVINIGDSYALELPRDFWGANGTRGNEVSISSDADGQPTVSTPAPAPKASLQMATTPMPMIHTSFATWTKTGLFCSPSEEVDPESSTYCVGGAVYRGNIDNSRRWMDFMLCNPCCCQTCSPGTPMQFIPSHAASDVLPFLHSRHVRGTTFSPGYRAQFWSHGYPDSICEAKIAFWSFDQEVEERMVLICVQEECRECCQSHGETDNACAQR